MDKSLKIVVSGLLLLITYNSISQNIFKFDTIVDHFIVEVPPSFMVFEDVGVVMQPRLKKKALFNCNRPYNYHLYLEESYIKDGIIFKKLNKVHQYLSEAVFLENITESGEKLNSKCSEIKLYEIRLKVVVIHSNSLIYNYSLISDKKCLFEINSFKDDENYFIIDILYDE